MIRGPMPSRPEVLRAIRAIEFQGLAYHRPVEWDARGDNRATITVLSDIEAGHFHELAQIGDTRDKPYARAFCH